MMLSLDGLRFTATAVYRWVICI